MSLEGLGSDGCIAACVVVALVHGCLLGYAMRRNITLCLAFASVKCLFLCPQCR